MNTLLDVKRTVRSLIGDDEGSWTNDSYLVPKINFAYRTEYLKLKTQSGQSLEQMVEIPDFTDANGNDGLKGLTSLAQFQQPGEPLVGLYQPMYLWWKPAGQPPSSYKLAVEKQTMPIPNGGSSNNVAPPSFVGSGMYWTWRSSQIFVSPINRLIDLLIDGRFGPPPLVKDEDVLVVHPDMETLVSPSTLAMVGVESGNTGWQTAGATMVEDARDNICNLLQLAKQGYTARAGHMGRFHRRGWFWF